MTVDLVAALNAYQKKYRFNTILIPPKRRYQSYLDGHYDVIFYESKTWGWQDIDIEASNVYQKGGEVYLALKKSGRGQDYFDDLNGKKMIGILGFHYGFADFNSDEEFLTTNYNMLLTPDNERNIHLLLKQRGDIAIVTKAYLSRYLLEYPDVSERLLISKKMDQEYNHTILLRPEILPSKKEMNSLLMNFKKSGEMDKLLLKYGFNPEL